MKQIKFKNSIDRNVFRVKSRDHQRLGIISAVIMIIVILALDASLDNFYDESKPTVTVEVIPNE